MERSESFLGRVLWQIGKLVGSNPWKSVLLTLVLSCGLGSGLGWMACKFTLEDLFLPRNSLTLQKASRIDQLFGNNVRDNFELGRATSIKRFCRLIIIPKDGGSVLRRQIFKDLRKIDKIVKNITVTHDNTTYTYEKMCAKQYNRCFPNEILHLYRHIGLIQDGSYFIKYPLQVDLHTLNTVFYPLFLGSVQVDQNNNVKFAQAASLIYIVDFGDPAREQMNEEWENKFLQIFGEVQMEHVTVYRFSAQSIVKESRQVMFSSLPKFGVSICVALFLVILVCWIQSRDLGECLVILSSVIASFLAGISSYGLGMYLQVSFFAIYVCIAMVLFGTTMFQTMALWSTWILTDTQQDLPSRVASTYSQALIPSILSSASIIVTFCLLTLLPYNYTICFFTFGALTVAFTQIYFLTIMGPALVLTYRFSVSKTLSKASEEDPKKSRRFKNFISTTFVTIHTSRKGNISTGLIYLIYLSISFFGAFQFRPNLNDQLLSDDTSYADKFREVYYEHFTKYSARIQIVFPNPINYHQLEWQQKIENLSQTIENLPFMVDSSLTESWLRHFLFLESSIKYNPIFRFNISKKEDFIKCLNNVFLKIPAYFRFKKDIALNENKTEIIASRLLFQFKESSDLTSMMNGIEEIRKILASQSFEAFEYTVHDIYTDNHQILLYVFQQSIWILCGIFSLFTCLLLFRLRRLLMSVFTLASILVGIFGFLALWNVYINFLTIIMILASYIIPIELISHIVYLYNNCKLKSTEKRLNFIFNYMAFPYILSYIYFVIQLLFLPIFQTLIKITMFKILFISFSVSIFHTLFVLPCITQVVKCCINDFFIKVYNVAKKEEKDNKINKNKFDGCIIEEKCKSTVKPV